MPGRQRKGKKPRGSEDKEVTVSDQTSEQQGQPEASPEPQEAAAEEQQRAQLAHLAASQAAQSAAATVPEQWSKHSNTALLAVSFYNAVTLEYEPPGPALLKTVSFYNLANGPKSTITPVKVVEPSPALPYTATYTLPLPTGCHTLVGITTEKELAALLMRPEKDPYSLDFPLGRAASNIVGGTIEVRASECGHDHGHLKQLDSVRVSAELVKGPVTRADVDTTAAPSEQANISAVTRNGTALLEVPKDGQYRLQAEVPSGYKLQGLLPIVTVCRGEFVAVPVCLERCAPTLTLVVTDSCGQRLKDAVPLLVNSVEYCVQGGECTINNPRAELLHLSSPSYEVEPREIRVDERISQAFAVRATLKKPASAMPQNYGFKFEFEEEVQREGGLAVYVFELGGTKPIAVVTEEHGFVYHSSKGRMHEFEAYQNGELMQERVAGAASLLPPER
jgi:hypothetical protein